MTDGRSWIFSPPGFKFGPFCAEQSILDVFSPAIAMFAPTSSFSAAVQVRDLRDAAVPSRLCGRVGAGHHHLRHAAVMCGSARGAAAGRGSAGVGRPRLQRASGSALPSNPLCQVRAVLPDRCRCLWCCCTSPLFSHCLSMPFVDLPLPCRT